MRNSLNNNDNEGINNTVGDIYIKDNEVQN